MTTTASFATAALRVEPGSTTTVTLTVQNDSDIVEAYSFGVVGMSPEWVSFAPERLTVYPGKSEKVTITFAPPRSPTTAAGATAFGIRVVPSERPDNATVPESSLTVLPFADTTAELLPRVSHARRRVRPQLAIDNRGNTPLHVVLDGKDPSDQVTLGADPQELVVEPGAAAFATVNVRARKSIVRGQNLAHPFLVTVSPDGQRALPVDGTFLQVPVLPSWFTKALIAALAVIAALVIAWFTLLKPALDSAATSATAAQQSAAAANQAASKATGQPVTPITPPKKGTTVTASTTFFRLQGSSGSSQWKAQNNATLDLTDVVLANPQGDYGLLTLSSGSTTIFSVELANFRNDDYHFLTPLLIKPGDGVKLTIRCDSPGMYPVASGTAKAETSCDDSVLVSGSLLTPKQ